MRERGSAPRKPAFTICITTMNPLQDTRTGHASPHGCRAGGTSDDILYVIAVISNPRRFKRRYELYKEFEQRMLNTHGIRLITVEAAYRDRDFEVTRGDNPDHVQVHINDRAEIWLKESLINAGVAALPCGWKYVAWYGPTLWHDLSVSLTVPHLIRIDADVTFANKNWVKDTIESLQHHPFVQLFQTAADLGVDGEIMSVFNGFGWNWARGQTPPKKGKTYNGHWYCPFPLFFA
jgi:hypothetical protein